MSYGRLIDKEERRVVLARGGEGVRDGVADAEVMSDVALVDGVRTRSGHAVGDDSRTDGARQAGMHMHNGRFSPA